MAATITTRPRNVDWKRAAAILYGDWGTSKAYVRGRLLTALVGINYIWICKYFPDGGGVYSSPWGQSRHLALVGGFLLIADYIVTAAVIGGRFERAAGILRGQERDPLPTQR